MKNFCENNINTDSRELSLLMCGASLFSHLLLVWRKDEHLCSLLEAVPRVVILRHLLQPVVWLLLRLVVVFFVVARLLPLQILLLCRLPQHLIPNHCQQPEFHWLFLLKLQFLGGHSQHLQRPTCLVRLLCVTVPNSGHLISWKYGLLLLWQQNKSKATLWLLHNITAMRGCPSRF